MKLNYAEIKSISENDINSFMKLIKSKSSEEILYCNSTNAYLDSEYEKLKSEGLDDKNICDALKGKCLEKILSYDVNICFSSLIFNNPFRKSEELRKEILTAGLKIGIEDYKHFNGNKEIIIDEINDSRFFFYCNEYIACITCADASDLTDFYLLKYSNEFSQSYFNSKCLTLYNMISKLKNIKNLMIMNKEHDSFEPVANLFSDKENITASDIAIELYDYQCIYKVSDCYSDMSLSNYRYSFPVSTRLQGYDGCFCYNRIDYSFIELQRNEPFSKTIDMINNKRGLEEYLSVYEETVEKCFYSFLEQYVTFAVFLTDCKSWVDKNYLALDEEEEKENKEEANESKAKAKGCKAKSKERKDKEKERDIIIKELNGHISLLNKLSTETYKRKTREKDNFSIFRKNYFEQFRDSGKKDEVFKALKDFKSMIYREKERKEDLNNERLNRITLGLSLFAILSVASDVSTYIRNYHDNSFKPSFDLGLPLGIVGALFLLIILVPLFSTKLQKWKNKRKMRINQES